MKIPHTYRIIIIDFVVKINDAKALQPLRFRRPCPKQGGREQEGGRQKTILKPQREPEGGGGGRGQYGGPYLSDKSGPLSKEDRQT